MRYLGICDGDYGRIDVIVYWHQKVGDVCLVGGEIGEVLPIGSPPHSGHQREHFLLINPILHSIHYEGAIGVSLSGTVCGHRYRRLGTRCILKQNIVVAHKCLAKRSSEYQK